MGLNTNLSIACFLIRETNADINVKNRRGKTALEVLEMVKLSDSEPNTPFNYDLAKEFLLGLIERRIRRSNNAHQRTGPLCTASDDAIVNQSESECTQSGETPIGCVDINTSSDKSVAKESQSNDCILCNELNANVVFEPCGHSLVCHLCSVRIKKCIECHQLIESKSVKQTKLLVDSNISDHSIGKSTNSSNNNSFGNNSNSNSNITNHNNKHNNQKVSLERLQYLESKIAEIEEANSCTICMIPYTHNGVLRMAFLCGHSACFNCAQTLKTCHMCRKTITRKINLY